MGTISTILSGRQSFIRRFAENVCHAVYFAWCILLILPKRAAKQRSREVLRNLDDDQLRDIGISREQANEEAEKPFWE